MIPYIVIYIYTVYIYVYIYTYMTDPCLCVLVFIAVRSCLFASFPWSFRAPGGTSQLLPTAGATWVGEGGKVSSFLLTSLRSIMCKMSGSSW